MKFVRNAYKRLKKNVTERIKVIKRDHLVREYFKNNILFLTYVLVCVLNSTMLRFLCMHSVENYLSLKAILADTIVVSAVGAFGYLLKPKDRFAYYFGFCIIRIYFYVVTYTIYR